MPARRGKTATFSISVDEETRRILKEEAERAYGGNVSALVAAIAKEAKRKAALGWLLQGVEPMRADTRDALLAEIDGSTKPPVAKKRDRRAA